MAYTPSLNDIDISGVQNSAPSSGSNSNNAYIPSLADINTSSMNVVSQPSIQTTNGTSPAQPSSPSSTLVNNAIGAVLPGMTYQGIGNFMLGGIDSLRNFGSDLQQIQQKTMPGMSNVLPQGQIPQVPQAQGFAGDLGRIAGNVVPFTIGGEGLEAARAATAASDIPAVNTAAQWLGGKIPNIPAKFGGSTFLPTITRQGIGGGVYGAITNPQDTRNGAAKGAAWGALFGALPGAISGTGKVFDYFNPSPEFNNLMQQIGSDKANYDNVAQNAQNQIDPLFQNTLNTLSQGAGNLENSGKSVASEIAQNYTKNNEANSVLYQPVFNELGNQSLYNESSPYITGNRNVSINALSNSGNRSGSSSSNQLSAAYPSIANKVANQFDSDTADAHSQFINNPTFQNAHNLQSQLGTSLAQLRRNPFPDNSTRATINAMQQAKNGIDSDIQSFLKNASPDLQAQYANATNDFHQNVGPYRNDPTIAQIAKGYLTNPPNIANIFKNPEPDIQKVIDDLSSGAKNQILRSGVGKFTQSKSPEALVNSYQKGINDSGLQSYVTPELQQQMDTLQSLLNQRNQAQTLSKSLSKINNIKKPQTLINKIGSDTVANDENLQSYLPSIQNKIDALSGTLNRQNKLYHGLGIGAGALAGHHFHDTGAGEILGALIGNTFMPSLIKGLAMIPGRQALFNGIGKAATTTYPYLSPALRANLIPGAQ